MKLWCGNCWGKEEIRQQSNTENQIVELQGLGIDAVSGATLTSNAILDGVADLVLMLFLVQRLRAMPF